MLRCRQVYAAALAGTLGLAATMARAQSAGNSGSIYGAITDPTGAVVPNATVRIRNPVSGFERSITTNDSGMFEFSNIPFNPCHLSVTAYKVKKVVLQKRQYLFVGHCGASDGPASRVVQNPAGSCAVANWKYA